MAINYRQNSKSKKSWPLPGSIKKAIDRMDVWDKKHFTPPAGAGFKMGESYLLPKSSGDRQGWMKHSPRRSRIKLPKSF